MKWTLLRSVGVSLMVGTMFAIASSDSSAQVLFHAGFDETLDATGRLTAPAEAQVNYAPGLIGKAVSVPGGSGPLVYKGSVGLGNRGAVAFWIGSIDLVGYEPQVVPLFQLKDGRARISFVKGADAYLYVTHVSSDPQQPDQHYRYPIYDLLPGYSPSRGADGSVSWGRGPELRHFLTYQWGDRHQGLYLNGVKGEPCNAPNGMPAPPAEDGIVLGAADKGLLFDEVIVSDAPRTPDEIRSLYVGYLGGDFPWPKAQITVTEHRGQPITIDGRLDEEEWKYATVVGGLHVLRPKTLLPYEATFLVTYDKERIYFGMRTFADYPLEAYHGTPGVTPPNEGRPWRDDSFAVLLSPYDAISRDYFFFTGNPLGYYVDMLGTDPTVWDGDWEYAVQVKDGVWTAELSIPYASMQGPDNRAEYPSDGSTWTFNVARSWKGGVLRDAARHPTTALAYGAGYGELHQFAIMQFESRGIATRLHDIQPGDDVVRITLGAFNTGDQPRQLTFSALAYDGPLPYSQINRDVRIEAGQTMEQVLELPLKGRERCPLEWKIVETETDRVLYRGSGQWPTAPALSEAELADLRERRMERPIRMHTAQTPVAEAEVEDDRIALPTPQEIDQALLERTEWKNNTLGISDQVPPPWTPVAVNDGKVSVWGRDYDFKDALILGGSDVQGQSLLTGPIALVLEIDGQQVRYTRASSTVTSARPARVELVSVGGDETLTLVANTWIEYDGCIWTELKLQPRRDIRFDRMWIEVPYATADAGYFSWFRDKESASAAGRIPAEGLQATWRPYVWLGDVTQGMALFTDEYRDWFTKDPETNTVTLIEPDQDTTRLKILLANEPAVLDAPMAVEFGLMATPVRPLPSNHRLYEYSQGWSYVPGKFIEWATGYFVHEPRDPEAFAQVIERDYERNPYRIASPNVGSAFYTSSHYADGRIKPSFWLLQNDIRQDERYSVRRQLWRKPAHDRYIQLYSDSTPTRTYIDWFLYRYHRMMQQYPLLRGIYMDGQIWQSANRVGGTGFTDRYGNRRASFQIMGNRQLLKRLYTMFWQLRGDPAENPWVLYQHCSNQMCAPVHSFATAILQGEGLMTGPRGLTERPLRQLPIDTLRVGYNGHVLGIMHDQLPAKIANNNPEVAEELYAMFVLQDSHKITHNIRFRSVMNLVEAKAGLSLADDEVVFYPWWGDEPPVRSLTEGGYVNAYTRPKDGSAILFVTSLDIEDAPTAVQVVVDRSMLGLPRGQVTARDLYTEQQWTLPAGEDRFTVPMRRNSFRYLELR